MTNFRLTCRTAAAFGMITLVAITSAEEPQEAAAPADDIGVTSHIRREVRQATADNEKIYQVLETPMKFEDLQWSVARFVEDIEERSGIPVRLRTRKLEDEGISPNEEFAGKRGTEPLGRRLRWVLEEEIGDLTYVVRDGVLWVTTVTDASVHPDVRLYDITQFVTKRTEDEVRLYREAMANNTEALSRLAVRNSNGRTADPEGLRNYGQASGFFQFSAEPTDAESGPSEGPSDMPDVALTFVPSVGDYYDIAVVKSVVEPVLEYYGEEKGISPVVVGERVLLSLQLDDQEHRRVVEALERLRVATDGD